jgi:SAM-dependent methyltransferase
LIESESRRFRREDDLTIKSHIQKYYADLYEGMKECRVPIQTGRDLAAALGYPLDFLTFIPESYWKRFVPCGNPLRLLHPVSGERILNLGCGAAIDSFALSALYGASVQVVSMDIVFGVLQKASEVMQCPLEHHCPSAQPQRAALRWICGDGEQLPFQPETFQWVLMNGVFNLFPDKVSLLGEVNRVLGPDGRLIGTDLCIDAPLPEYFHEERDAWAWCMSGACTEERLTKLLLETGFEKVRVDREEDGEMFCRAAFSCRKGSSGLF